MCPTMSGVPAHTGLRWARGWMRSAPVAMAVVLAAVSCRPVPPSRTHQRELVVSLAADADMLFPPFTATSQGAAISDQILERLADPDSTLNTIGDRSYRPRLPIHGVGQRTRCRSRFTSTRVRGGRTAFALRRAT